MPDRTALLVVDVQNDFADPTAGTLFVPGGDQVAERIGTMIAKILHAGSDELIVFSRDWHNPLPDTNGGHFSTVEGDHGWPVHCVSGTWGAEFHPAVEAVRMPEHVVISKGQGAHGYSAFDGTTDTGATLEDVFAENGITAVDVVGLATDFCVSASAFSARGFGLPTRLLTRFTAGVYPDLSNRMISKMREQGVVIS